MLSFRLLRSLQVSGFKSINNLDLQFEQVNILIGWNGAGKSNLVDLFLLLKHIVARDLKNYPIKNAESLFYKGNSKNSEIRIRLEYINFSYSVILSLDDEKSLFIKHEELILGPTTKIYEAENIKESKLIELSCDNEDLSFIPDFCKHICGVYRLQCINHDAMKQCRSITKNNSSLDYTGFNLVPYMYMLKTEYNSFYGYILSAIKLALPSLEDIYFEKDEQNIEDIHLRWKAKGVKESFDLSDLSLASLRFICLAVILLQPNKLQPNLIIIDDADLGLSPLSIKILEEFIVKATHYRQIAIATQSTQLVDRFDAENIITVEMGSKGSLFNRLRMDSVNVWLQENYSLSEQWTKNNFSQIDF